MTDEWVLQAPAKAKALNWPVEPYMTWPLAILSIPSPATVPLSFFILRSFVAVP